MKDKIIVFEEIYNYSRPLVAWYRLNGYHVYYFRLNAFCKDKRWVKKCLEKKVMVNIDSKYDMLSTFIGIYPDPAYDNIEKIAGHILSDDPVIAVMTKLYGDEGICGIFKKEIGAKLERFYYLNYIFHNLNKVFPYKQVYFIPTLQKEGYRVNIITSDDYFNFLSLIRKSGAASYDYEKVFFPSWFRLTSKLYGLAAFLITNLNIFGFMVLTTIRYPAGALNKYRGIKKNYKFGIMILSQEAQFATESQKADFLIDGRSIKKDAALFICPQKLFSQNRDYMIQNKLNFADGIMMRFSLNADKGAILLAIMLLFKSIKYRRKAYIIETSLLALIYRLIWVGFKEEYHVDNLVTYCDFSKQSIARNLLLSKDGTKTWYYLHTNNFINYYIPATNKANFPQYSPCSLLGYLNYDYVLTWSDEISGYFKKHNQDVKNYKNVGCLWAEHISGITTGEIRTEFKDKLYKAGFKDDYSLIAVFDSTYLDNSITTYEDGINFINGILRLLEDVSDIFIVFKEKKTRQFVGRYSKEILNFFDKLQSHPRCFMPFNKISTSEAIAYSDLTISFPFTSATFEALSARKKAVYYDASDKFRGAYYDKTPGLVCHTYDELRERVKELLYNIKEEEYNVYLNSHVKSRIESYLDGMAINRFRESLVNEN